MPKRVLLLALNWGLGHTTRIIPVIHEIIRQGGIPVFAGTEKQLALVRENFPKTEGIRLDEFEIRLSASNFQVFKLVSQLPKMWRQLILEHRKVKELVKEFSIDVIIADNVYGAYHSSVHSVFICHQLKIRLPRAVGFMEGVVNWINQRFIKKFDACWIPDLPGENALAGELSQPAQIPANATYIGNLSRLTAPVHPVSKIKNRVLILLSGPEPQRSILENIMRTDAAHLTLPLKLVWVRGLPGNKTAEIEDTYSYLAREELVQEILCAEFIICRSGYSTLMDLRALNRTALLIPTPGQSEQEYLAEYLTEKAWFQSIKQENFSFEKALPMMRRFEPKPSFQNPSSDEQLGLQLREILSLNK